MAKKNIEKIRIGDVVKGDFGGWWRITTKSVDKTKNKDLKDSVWMDAVNVVDGSAGFIRGLVGEKRTVR